MKSISQLQRAIGSVGGSIFLLVMIIVPFILSWWYVNSRFPELDVVKKRLIIIAKLENQINTSNMRLSETVFREVSNKWNKIRVKLLNNYETMAAWIEVINSKAIESGFTMSYKVGTTQSSYIDIPAFSMLHLDIILSPVKANKNMYKKSLDLLKYIVNSSTGLELKGVIMKGDGKGLNMLTLSIDILVGFKDDSMPAGSDINIGNRNT